MTEPLKDKMAGMYIIATFTDDPDEMAARYERLKLRLRVDVEALAFELKRMTEEINELTTRIDEFVDSLEKDE